MKLNEALKKGNKVCVALKDDKREVGCYIVFSSINDLTKLLDSVVGELVRVNSGDFDYIKTLYVSEKPFEELVFDLIPSRKGGA